MNNIMNEYKNTIKNNYIDEGSFYKEVKESEVKVQPEVIKQNIDNKRYDEYISGVNNINNIMFTFENLECSKQKRISKTTSNANSIGKNLVSQYSLELPEEGITDSNKFTTHIIVAKF
jgi:hypothetical protein